MHLGPHGKYQCFKPQSAAFLANNIKTGRAAGAPEVGSILGRFIPWVSIKILWLQHMLYWGAFMGTEVT